MFQGLTDTERRALADKLHRAGERLLDEGAQLHDAPAGVTAAYHLPRDGYHDFYDFSAECSSLSIEIRRSFAETGTGWPR